MSSVAVPAELLTVVQLIPALDSGGAERSALEIGRALVAAGHRSIVISAGGRLVAQLEAEGSEHVTLDIGRKSLRTLSPSRRIARGCSRELKPDIVHARSRLPAWLGWCALRGHAAAAAFRHHRARAQFARPLQRHHDARRARDRRVAAPCATTCSATIRGSIRRAYG